MRLCPPLKIILNGFSSRNSEATSLFMAFTNVNNWRMENTVIGAVFVVCHGFRDNGDGM